MAGQRNFFLGRALGKDTGDIITVSAFDKMIWFDKSYTKSKLKYPATLREILQGCVASCCSRSPWRPIQQRLIIQILWRKHQTR